MAKEHFHLCVIDPKFPIIGHSSPRGFLWPILRGLAAQGHSITAIAWENPFEEPSINQNGIRTLFIKNISQAKSFSKFEQLCFEQVQRLHKEQPIDVIHSLTKDGRLLATNKKTTKIPIAFDSQATHMDQIFSYIGLSEASIASKLKSAARILNIFLRTYFYKDRPILKKADGLFVNSHHQTQMLERYYLYPERKIHQVPYNVNLQDLSLRQRSEDLAKSLQLSKHSKVIVTFSDMNEKSEMSHILRAFQKVAVKSPSSRLIVVGDGPNFKKIEYEMLNLALSGKVKFVGDIPEYEVPNYIDLSDIFINLSSRDAGYESRTFDAMAQEKIVIGSEVSSLTNVIENNLDGYLLRPADKDSLSSLVLDIFFNPGNYTEVGVRARQKVLELFKLEKLIASAQDAYVNIIKSSRL